MAEKPTYEELEQRCRKFEDEALDFKRIVKELYESHDYLDKLFSYANDPIIVWNPKGMVTRFNRAFEHMTSLTADEIVGHEVCMLFPEASRDESLSKIAVALSGEYWESVEIPILCKDGDVRTALWNSVHIYAEDGTTVIATIAQGHDITEFKQAEEDLNKSENKLRLLLNTMIDYCYIVSKDHKIEFMNKALKDKLGDQTGKICYKAFFGLESPCPWSKLENVIAGETVRWQHYLPKLEGFFEIIDTPLTNQDGTVSKLGLWRDITDRKQAEDALKESGEKYRLLFNKSNDSVFVYQLTKDHMPVNFIDVNEVVCKKLGYTREELLKLTPLDIISPKDRDLLPSIIRKLCKGKSSFFESTHITKDGREIPVHINPNMFELHGELTVLCVARDISEHKQAEKEEQRLQAQLQRAQKMEAIGTLAGGIAHDFNNLLMGIQGRASLILMDKDSSYPDFEHLKEIEDCVKSAADLTGQLLGFARGGKYEVEPTDINELIKKSSRMFGRTKKEIKIHRKYQKDVWTVEADQGQIDQVLMNLYVNAWQAMQGGGKLYIQTENVTLDKDYVKPFEIKPGKYVKISVTDTGHGMDEATRERIFDPFFTTKEMGRGTGLGLASAYGIIKNHGGFINVYSEKGEGTTFNIYLPASESELVRSQSGGVSNDVRHGHETVLLVDDEDMIIDVGELLLKKMGYTVLTARSGKEATEIYEKNKDKIDLIILDMIMPDMSGGDTFDRLKEINPEIKVLLSSGYSINGQATEILERGCDGFIQKPFNMKQLSYKIREVLDKEQAHKII
ncbi:MAG: PAS domain S-box protein, partial [Thermodesulfobacteriota bacterium]|nr:PAS domain S-box protein [Thermodesulfobacteriota bacterium]